MPTSAHAPDGNPQSRYYVTTLFAEFGSAVTVRVHFLKRRSSTQKKALEVATRALPAHVTANGSLSLDSGRRGCSDWYFSAHLG